MLYNGRKAVDGSCLKKTGVSSITGVCGWAHRCESKDSMGARQLVMSDENVRTVTVTLFEAEALFGRKVTGDSPSHAPKKVND